MKNTNHTEENKKKKRNASTPKETHTQTHTKYRDTQTHTLIPALLTEYEHQLENAKKKR